MSNITQTSIYSYHNLESEGTQVLTITAFLVNETKHARSHSIRTIADHFYMTGNRSLSQTGTVSARFNRIKENGVMYDGRKYRLELVNVTQNATTKRPNEYYFLVIDAPKAEAQMALF